MKCELLTIIGLCAFAVHSQPSDKGVVRIYVLTEIGTPIDNATVRIDGVHSSRTIEVRGPTSVELPFGVYTMACIHKTLATQFKIVRVERPTPIDAIFGLTLANPGQVSGEGDFSPFEVLGRVIPPPPRGVFGRIRAIGIFTDDLADSKIDDIGVYRILLRNEGVYRIFIIFGKDVVREEMLNLTFDMPRRVNLDYRVGDDRALPK